MRTYLTDRRVSIIAGLSVSSGLLYLLLSTLILRDAIGLHRMADAQRALSIYVYDRDIIGPLEVTAAQFFKLAVCYNGCSLATIIAGMAVVAYSLAATSPRPTRLSEFSKRAKSARIVILGSLFHCWGLACLLASLTQVLITADNIGYLTLSLGHILTLGAVGISAIVVSRASSPRI